MVTFFDGSTALATVPLSAGSATYSTSILSVASHSITFQFTPSDSNFVGSTSAAFTQVVHQSYTSTALMSSLNPSTFGTSVTFTAVVTATAPGSGIPGGAVTFKDGSKTLMVVPLDPTGTATFTISTLSIGNHTISATYGGNTNYRNANPASLTQVVNAAANGHAMVAVLTTGLTRAGATVSLPEKTIQSLPPGSGTMMPDVLASFRQEASAAREFLSQKNQTAATATALDQFFSDFGNGKSDLTDPEDKA
jgi:hypothetical protein